jgi:nitroreductase
VKDLEDGLYHFSIHRHGLVPLRIGDFFHYIMQHTHSSLQETPAVMLFLTAIFFRSAWKYRARSYRYHLLDTGHVMENMCLALRAMEIPYRFSFDFGDKEINLLLGLDETKEVALAMVYVPCGNNIQTRHEQGITRLPDRFLFASVIARNETDYPAVREIHQAGERISLHEASIPDMTPALGLIPDTWEKVPPGLVWPETMDYPDTVFQRRSQRHYVIRAMPKNCLLSLLDALCKKDLQDTENTKAYEASIAVGLIINKVDGFMPGLYLLNRSDQSMGRVTGPVSPDQSTAQMARVCLGQSWLAEASVHFLFMTNLELLDHTWGPRGYRYAMLTAGRLGERLYVASTAMGLGCCGIGAFYDRHAANAIGLNDASHLLYLVAVGTMK